MKRTITLVVLCFETFIVMSQNVGIGTNNPTNKLHVSGIIRSDTIAIGTSAARAPLSFAPVSGAKITLWDDGNVAGDNYGIGVVSGLLQIHTYTINDDIAFGYGRSSSFTETMRIKGNGNVGINTPSPQAKLTINGNIQITDGTQAAGKVLTSDANGIANWQNIPASTGGWTVNGSNIYSANSGNVGIGTMVPSNKLSVTGNVDFSGNVGIGFNSPSYKLHVSNAANSLRIEGPSASGTNGVSFGMGGYGQMMIDKPGIVGGRFIIKENGNVGINQNTPSSTLDVNGDINTTGLIKLNGNAGEQGQVFTSNGPGSDPAWVSPTNFVYNNSYKKISSVFVNVGGSGNPTSVIIPDLEQSFTVSKRVMALISWNYYAYSTSCAFCGDITLHTVVKIDNGVVQELSKSLANATSSTQSGSTITFVEAGTHTIQVFASNFSSNIVALVGGNGISEVADLSIVLFPQ